MLTLVHFHRLTFIGKFTAGELYKIGMQKQQLVKPKPQKPKPTRQDKAFALVKNIVKKDGTTYSVPSQSDSSKVYEVVHFDHKFGCSCPDFLCRGNVEACKHIYAVKLFMEEEKAKEEKAAAVITTTTTDSWTKEFPSTKHLLAWLDYPLSKKTYKVMSIDWANNSVQVIKKKTAQDSVIADVIASNQITERVL